MAWGKGDIKRVFVRGCISVSGRSRVRTSTLPLFFDRFLNKRVLFSLKISNAPTGKPT
jgi:hypothetical protein